MAEHSEMFCLKACIDFWLNTKTNIFALPAWDICQSYTDALQTIEASSLVFRRI